MQNKEREKESIQTCGDQRWKRCRVLVRALSMSCCLQHKERQSKEKRGIEKWRIKKRREFKRKKKREMKFLWF